LTKSSLWTYENITDQTGKIAIITGANSGIGFHTSRALAAKGAKVVMACRDLEKGQHAVSAILEDYPRSSLELFYLDLADLRSVKSLVHAFAEKHTHLHILINNAGLMATPYRQTVDGFELQFGVNHLGHFALTGLLLEQLLSTPAARVVTVTSMMYITGIIDFTDLMSQKKYNRWNGYARSKLANLLFVYELQRRLQAHGCSSISLAAHPGYAATNLQVTGPGMDQNRLLLLAMKTGNLFAQSEKMGALPSLFAAVAPDAQGADFIGPGGLMGMRGYPVKCQSNATSHDPATAERLWAVSEELTGVHYSRLDL
jgi:NAD(P)-dependent dehydrogenase (short-subunit alcohol dehydrogenase family)